MSKAGTDTSRHEAIEHARIVASETMLPQTVYRDRDSGGWWHINFAARRLEQRGCELLVTVLPRRYFS
ncbi:hypothetical protein AB3X94_37390 [Paraburkholderia sp. BR10923]|uniref:hypothetical protein n=1 Tax=Paraburkholderia sp. BR10923 TaxID=3236992 RepID=UPI0034CF545D